METKNEIQEIIDKFESDVEKLMRQIEEIDRRLAIKYQEYPKSTVMYHQYDNDAQMLWEIYIGVISGTDIENNWEVIKNMYMLKLNAIREYSFEISTMKSTTLSCKTKNVKITFNVLSPKISKKNDIELLKQHCNNNIIWGIECKDKKEENNLPDTLIAVLTEMEFILKNKFSIILVENLHLVTGKK